MASLGRILPGRRNDLAKLVQNHFVSLMHIFIVVEDGREHFATQPISATCYDVSLTFAEEKGLSAVVGPSLTRSPRCTKASAEANRRTPYLQLYDEYSLL